MDANARAPRESDLLDAIRAASASLSSTFPRVLVGPGHDCAALATAPTSLLKVDQLVEGRHYRGPAGEATPLDLVARKALNRPLSDIAAAGGRPACALASALVPRSFRRASELFELLRAAAERARCPLIGGDIASCDTGPLTLAVFVLGEPHPARGVITRAGAQPGDRLYITGRLGGSLDPATGRGRHLTFEPRLPEAAWLCDVLGPDLHAMIDISDGLGIDASRLAVASGVSIRINASALPLAPGVTDPARALADGEDYELLVAVGGGRGGKSDSSRVPRDQYAHYLHWRGGAWGGRGGRVYGGDARWHEHRCADAGLRPGGVGVTQPAARGMTHSRR